VGDAIVGVVANPLSGRDIRRLVTQASVFPTTEKANMIQRMLTAFGAVGVHRVLLSTDLGGISASVFRAVERHRSRDARWPEVDFLDGQPIRQTAQDTVDAVRRMVTAGTRVIVILGGDGTARVAASAAGDVPMLALSTGTNNVFPAVREATVAGLAAGLVATGLVPADGATTRAKLLEVRAGGRTETALVDVAVSTERHVGARAIWNPATVTQLFCAFAEPDAIGLSSILGQLAPVARHEPYGVTAHLSPAAPRQVLAPIAPGLVVPVGVADIERMRPGPEHHVEARTGVIAVDGERELTFEAGEHPLIKLRADGPRCVDVPAVLAASARLGLLRRTHSQRTLEEEYMTDTAEQRALTRDELLSAYRTMRAIREFEERVHAEFATGEIPGFVHLYAGEEASAVGVCSNLDDRDTIASTHRGHGHCIARGVDMAEMMAEIYGRRTGSCHGKGGSMHIADLSKGMLGANGIVGGGPPLICGTALAAKLKGTGGVSVAFFGDGGSNQGTTLESMNLASVWNLPAIFVAENNGYAETTASTWSVASDNIADRAAGFGMPGVIVDGFDFFAVHEAASEAIARARDGGGPTLIEMKFTRYFGHFEGDQQTYRADEVARARAELDCLMRFADRVTRTGELTGADLDAVDAEVAATIDAAVESAKAAPLPTEADLLTDVYVRY
jgi:acetoin:2,6-dichlorophenolindophenol oxidoreductase subunit alpha